MAFTAQGITPEQIAALSQSGPAPAPAASPVSQPFNGYVEGGRAYFSDSTGKVFSAPEAEAGAALASDPTLKPATGDQVTAWRNRPGPIEAASAQFGRGVLDALLAPGALVGAGAEGAGELFDSDTLRDFGRDLGEASSGKAAIEALGFVATGDTSTADRARKRIEEQEKHWPMLSTLSRMSGMAAFGLGTGSLAAKGGASATTLAIGSALEGAAGGAQAAYAESAPLRDVLTSTLLGTALGGAVGSAPVALKALKAGGKRLASKVTGETGFEVAGDLVGGPVGKAISAVPDAVEAMTPAARAVREALSEGAEAVAERSEVRAVGDYLRKVQSSVREAAERAGVNPEARLAAARQASADAVETVARKTGLFDSATWAETPPNALQKVFFRRQILDRASADLSSEIAESASVRPIMTAPLDGAKLSRLTRGIDETAAIAKVQQRFDQALAETPATQEGRMLREMLVTARRQMDEGDAAVAMQTAHKAAGLLDEFREGVTDKAAQDFAKRAALEIRNELGSPLFGKAGALYREMQPGVSSRIADLSDPAVMREAMRTLEGRGALTAAVREHSDAVRQAFKARERLTGEAAPEGLNDAFAALQKKAARAEEALTLDGGPIGEALRYASQNMESLVGSQFAAGAVGSAVGGLPGAVLGIMVANRVRPAIAKLAPHLRRTAKHTPGALREGIKRGGLLIGGDTRDEKALYDKRLEFLTQAAVAPQSRPELRRAMSGMRDIPGPLQQQAVEEAQRRMIQLQQDMPKPRRSIRGPAFETLSRDDMRKANAMWEATVDPLSIFDDFEGGLVDYTKVSYAWKQWPGLQQALKVGVVDMLQQQLTDDERATMPSSTLAQIDTLLGFGGTLQPTLSADFAFRITQSAQQQAKENTPPPRRGPLKIPDSTTTYTQRIAMRS